MLVLSTVAMPWVYLSWQFANIWEWLSVWWSTKEAQSLRMDLSHIAYTPAPTSANTQGSSWVDTTMLCYWLATLQRSFSIWFWWMCSPGLNSPSCHNRSLLLQRLFPPPLLSCPLIWHFITKIERSHDQRCRTANQLVSCPSYTVTSGILLVTGSQTNVTSSIPVLSASSISVLLKWVSVRWPNNFGHPFVNHKTAVTRSM